MIWCPTTASITEANGEGNRDGSENNLSWNCGVEGPTGDAEVERLRRQQIKNFIVTLLTSVGTPMLQMGDEMRRTQRGNNNLYCQDNEMSWLDWSLLDQHWALHRFVRTLIAYRLQAAEEGGADRFALSLNEVLSSARSTGTVSGSAARIGPTTPTPLPSQFAQPRSSSHFGCM